MVSLLDIAPVASTVEYNGQQVDVPGISAEGVAYLMTRFPALRAALMGRGLDVTPEGILEQGPVFVAALIAAGTGHHGNAEVEKVASAMPLGVQVEFLDQIVQRTLPGGVGPFVEKLEALMGVASNGSVDGGKGRVTKSQRPSKG